MAADVYAVLRVREYTSVVQKRFGIPENSVDHFAEKGQVMIVWIMAQASTKKTLSMADMNKAGQPEGAQEEGNHPPDG